MLDGVAKCPIYCAPFQSRNYGCTVTTLSKIQQGKCRLFRVKVLLFNLHHLKNMENA